jgi:hypothetical protein
MRIGRCWYGLTDGCRFCGVSGSARRCLLLIAGFACVALVAGCGTTHARARRPHVSSLAQQFQAAGLLDAAGNPEPAVIMYSGDIGFQWSMCAPGRKCNEIPSTHGMAGPGPQPTGTVFKLIATVGDQKYSTTLRWGGRVSVARRPTLSGTPRIGDTVRLSAARWAGGWGKGHEDLGIEACRTRTASGCVMLAGAALDCSRSGCGDLGGPVGGNKSPDSARVGDWYTGWYLFGLDAWLGNPTSLIVGFATPEAIKPWPSNQTIARSRPYGPITGPPAPTVSVLPRATVHGNRVLVATISCPVSCPAAISVQTKHPDRHDRIQWTTKERFKGTRTIGVSGTLPAGHATVTIQVGNGPYVKGHTLIRR